MTHLAFLIVDVDSGINLAASLIIIVAMILQAVVFFACLFVLVRLWSIVFKAFSGADEGTSRILLKLLGEIGVGGTGKGLTRKGKIKLTGTGVLGTILILFFGCVAIYLIGHHSATNSKENPKTIQTDPSNSPSLLVSED